MCGENTVVDVSTCSPAHAALQASSLRSECPATLRPAGARRAQSGTPLELASVTFSQDDLLPLTVISARWRRWQWRCDARSCILVCAALLGETLPSMYRSSGHGT